VDPAWRKLSEIAHYVSDKPEWPFHFQEVVLKGTGRTGEWDAFAPHNPEVQRFGDTFALCYIATTSPMLNNKRASPGQLSLEDFIGLDRGVPG
jgi:hypothetical protein